MWTLAGGDISLVVHEALCNLGKAGARWSLGERAPRGRQRSQPCNFCSQETDSKHFLLQFEKEASQVTFQLLSLSIYFFSVFENPFILSRFILGVPSSFTGAVKPWPFERHRWSLSHAPLAFPRPRGLTLGLLQFLTTNTCSISSELNFGGCFLKNFPPK